MDGKAEKEIFNSRLYVVFQPSNWQMIGFENFHGCLIEKTFNDKKIKKSD